MKTDFNSDGVVVPAPAATQPLTGLAPGGTATVVSVEDGGPVGRRLLELGLLPGTIVRALRHAPLGDPGVYELRGYRLCLRRSETDRVVVTPGRAGEPPDA